MQRALANDSVFQFLDCKRRENKHYYVLHDHQNTTTCFAMLIFVISSFSDFYAFRSRQLLASLAGFIANKANFSIFFQKISKKSTLFPRHFICHNKVSSSMTFTSGDRAQSPTYITGAGGYGAQSSRTPSPRRTYV